MTRGARQSLRQPTLQSLPQRLLRKTGRGFTLVEIAVAIAILGLALGTLLSLHTGYLSAALKDKHITRGALIAKQLMTLVEVAESAPEPGSVERDLFETLKDSGLVTEDEEGALKQELAGWVYRRKVEPLDLPEAADILRRIDLTIQWGDSTQESYTLVYFMRTLSD